MRVTETFKSIQGEGPATGEPCTFIRFSGCNLSCEGCDTDHSSSTDLTIDDLVTTVEAADLDLVVLTGGEPFIQPELPALISELYERGFLIDVETNGTVYVHPRVIRQLRHVVCSPKRGTETKLNLRGKFIKLVVTLDGNPSWTWPVHLLNDMLTDPQIVGESTVYLMPYGTTMTDAAFVWDLALAYGVRYSDRLQWRVDRK